MANIVTFGGGLQKIKKAIQQAATQARNVLAGTFFVDENGEVVEGEIPVYDDYQYGTHVGSATDDTGTYIAIGKFPEGYYQSSTPDSTWAPEIRSSATNFGNATVADVLVGKTMTSQAGLAKTGTMPNQSTLDSTIGGISTSYPTVPVKKGSNLQMNTTTTSKESLISIRVPKGYWDGDGYVGMASTSFGDATQAQVLSGKTFTSSTGVKKSGTMTNNGSLGTKTISAGGSYSIPAGYTSGGTVKASAASVTVTLLAHGSGRNADVSHTFSKAYAYAIITSGGYDAPSITTGSGWTRTHADNNSGNTAYGWTKANIAKNEKVVVHGADRYGIAIYGVTLNV